MSKVSLVLLLFLLFPAAVYNFWRNSNWVDSPFNVYITNPSISLMLACLDIGYTGNAKVMGDVDSVDSALFTNVLDVYMYIEAAGLYHIILEYRRFVK